MLALPARTVARIHRTLPIFRMDDTDRVWLYAPGLALEATPTIARDVESVLSAATPASNSDVEHAARRLETKARAAHQAWHDLAETVFEPECLTLFLSNQCNLGCTYCYSAPADGSRRRLPMHEGTGSSTLPVLSERVAMAAARLVLANCLKKGKRLTLVFHGGGEPTLHWALLQRLHEAIEQEAQARGVMMWSYIATHGVMSEDRARWLAEHFSLIGLSCDGPPEVQNTNRPSIAGHPTAAAVERSARVFAERGSAVAVRATITPDNVGRQHDIVAYACDRLKARMVRFEPAYGSRRMASSFKPEDAEAFVIHFLAAREAARARGCDLRVSGVRVDEIHGPYCNPLREVLQLTPDGVASACFLDTASGSPEEAVMGLGRFEAATGEFVIDQHRAATLRRRAARVPVRCEDCLNVYHCARDCPDVCVITADPHEEVHEGFRCRVQKLLGQLHVSEMACVE